MAKAKPSAGQLDLFACLEPEPGPQAEPEPKPEPQAEPEPKPALAYERRYKLEYPGFTCVACGVTYYLPAEDDRCGLCFGLGKVERCA